MPRKKVEQSAPRKLLTIKEASERLGHSVWTVRDWAYKGKIASHKFPNRLMVSDEEVDRIIAETYRLLIEQSNISKRI